MARKSPCPNILFLPCHWSSPLSFILGAPRLRLSNKGVSLPYNSLFATIHKTPTINFIMFRSLQQQPRVLTVFCRDATRNHAASGMLQYLRDSAGRHEDVGVEVRDKFPTQDQLQYMYRADPRLIGGTVGTVAPLFKLPSHNPLFGSPLTEAVNKGVWRDAAVWVDWEKQKVGTTLTSLKQHLP